MHVKRTLVLGLLLYTIIAACSPLVVFDVLTIPIANFTIVQAVFFGLADRRTIYWGIAGFLVVMLLVGMVQVMRNRLGSLCGILVIVGDFIHAGWIFTGDWFNGYVNPFAIQACMFDIVVAILYILYYVGQIKEHSEVLESRGAR